MENGAYRFRFSHMVTVGQRPQAQGFAAGMSRLHFARPCDTRFSCPRSSRCRRPGAGIDLIARARRTSAYAVRDALHLHRTGQHPPRRIDKRRRRQRQPGQPFIPKYQRIAAEVDRRRKAGEGFDRLAREMKVNRGTIVRAYDFANRGEAATAAREGRSPPRPPYKWSEESRVARRKPRG